MRLSLKSRLVAAGVAAVGAMALAGAPAGAASPNSFTLIGAGTISPGLTAGGGPQSWTFSGSGYGGGASTANPISCTLNGNDTIGTLTQGSGNFYGTCTTVTGTETMQGIYSRRGGAVTMSGNIGPAPYFGSFTAGCAFVPLPAALVRTFEESCTFVVP